ncbi:hypothetical protein FF38_06201 [Lucilia cuprina]|uniref:Uncharacterized protein n=1 Tax=Lucilia cuprina TaxID=7375 RepID=A0A0L0C6Q4_LUCCU|nr:hypothetical protein FF38_06201 [Lucilia cuprina]
MEARPDSELALQLPLLEWGWSSLLPKPLMRLWRFKEEWPELLTLIDFSDDEYEGFRSCENRLSFVRCVIKSCTRQSSSTSVPDFSPILAVDEVLFDDPLAEPEAEHISAFSVEELCELVPEVFKSLLQPLLSMVDSVEACCCVNSPLLFLCINLKRLRPHCLSELRRVNVFFPLSYGKATDSFFNISLDLLRPNFLDVVPKRLR